MFLNVFKHLLEHMIRKRRREPKKELVRDKAAGYYPTMPTS
jgi:hypothetical protein